MRSTLFTQKRRPIHIFQMSSDQDYFYKHPITVMLGFLGAAAILLLIVALALWVGYTIS